jgi:hypothetical protein
MAALARELPDQRLGPRGQPGQARLDRLTVGEGVQPLGAGLQLAGRLRPTQQQHRDQRALGVGDR